MDNITLMEEPFGRLNFDEIEEIDNTYYYYYDGWDILMKILTLALITSSILASIILVYAIRKFDYLRTRPNIYLMNFAICTAIYYFLSGLYELLFEFTIYNYIDHQVLCLIYKTDTIFLPITFTYATILSVDFFVVSLNVSWLKKYDEIQMYLIIFIYLFYVAQFILSVLMCFGSARVFDADISILEYFVLAVVVVVINVFNFFKKPTDESVKHKYLLIISSYVMFSWTPVLIFYFIFNSFISYNDSSTLEMITLWLFENLFKFLIFSMPLVSAFWLDVLNLDFRKAYRTIFNSIKRGEYVRGVFDDDNDDDDEGRLIENDVNVA